MRISVRTRNCDLQRWYLIEESADSEVELKIEFDQIVSVQSRNEKKTEICAAIQDELSKFEWLVVGGVNVEFLWYLHGVERQETDKVGDIDNITKPILDALTGANGILLDDSQIGSLHTFWQSRNENTLFNVLYLRISINNDTCLCKEKLYFIQYSGPVCLPINIDFNDPKSIVMVLVSLNVRRKQRLAAERIKRIGANVDRMLINSDWDIHRTRLNGFDKNHILSEKKLKQICCENGFTWRLFRTLWRPKKNVHA